MNRNPFEKIGVTFLAREKNPQTIKIKRNAEIGRKTAPPYFKCNAITTWLLHPLINHVQEESIQYQTKRYKIVTVEEGGRGVELRKRRKER